MDKRRQGKDLREIAMCDFCKKIFDVKTEFLNALCTGNDFILEEDGDFLLYIRTGDCCKDGIKKINYCPICGRKLVEK